MGLVQGRLDSEIRENKSRECNYTIWSGLWQN